MLYEKVSADMNFVEREKKTEKFWKDNDIFRKSMENRKEGETYTFYDGPPTANGKPHIGVGENMDGTVGGFSERNGTGQRI